MSIAGVVPNSSGVATSVMRLWQEAGGKWSKPASPKFAGLQSYLFELAAVPGTRAVWAGE